VQLLPLIYRNKREGLVFPGVAVTLACFHFMTLIGVYTIWSMLNIPENSNASNAEVMLLTSSLFFKRIHKPKKLQHAPSAATPQLTTPPIGSSTKAPKGLSTFLQIVADIPDALQFGQPRRQRSNGSLGLYGLSVYGSK
jgi:hypothetical protein